MQVSTKSLGTIYSVLVSSEERTNIMFMVQIDDPVRARHGSHQISQSTKHAFNDYVLSLYLCVVFFLLVLSLADTLLHALLVITRVAGGLLRVLSPLPPSCYGPSPRSSIRCTT